MNIKTGQDLLNEAKALIVERRASDVMAQHPPGDDTAYLDVRERNEWNLGRVPGAVHISRGNLESRVEALLERDKRIVVYCAQGNRSALAAATLVQMGYTQVISMADGWAGWVGADGEVED